MAREAITVGYSPFHPAVGPEYYHQYIIYTDKDGNQWVSVITNKKYGKK